MDQKKMSSSLCAVLLIFSADAELRMKALPHVDIENESIDWDAIWNGCLGGGHTAAVVWAKAIWCDEVATKSDPFERAFAMGPQLQSKVLEALRIRWSL